MKICEKCSNKLADSLKYCIKCGQEVTSNTKYFTEEKKEIKATRDIKKDFKEYKEDNDNKIMTNIFWFNGRIGRLNFSLIILVTIIFMGLLQLYVNDNGGGVFPFLIRLCLTWILICVTIKRFHDHGDPGMYAFLLLVPFSIIYIACMKGVTGSNQYGDDPLNNKNVNYIKEDGEPHSVSGHVKEMFKYKAVFNQDEENKTDKFSREITENEEKIDTNKEQSSAKYCRYCGIKHEKNAKFCYSCGKSFA